MNLVDRMWAYVKATQQDRMTMVPPRAGDLWDDLTKARRVIHGQRLEIEDLREAISYLADVVESLQARLENLEREEQ